jgi:hypothetical protein
MDAKMNTSFAKASTYIEIHQRAGLDKGIGREASGRSCTSEETETADIAGKPSD